MKNEPSRAARITIPPEVDFAALRLARNNSTGHVSFDWAPILAICEASGIEPELLRNGPEDNVGGLIVGWYAEHLARGGARDAVQDALIEEARLEDQHGHAYSHPAGQA